MRDSPEWNVIHNPQAGRFEIESEGLLAVLEYQLHDSEIVFTHTSVPEALGGQGLGSRLAAAGLAYARAQGLSVVPLCSFVAAYIQRHPEEQDLLAE
ncbi:MAG: N-acetyltransferase [Anaerolineales bacterium]|nr:N-acetyltransferase [Anaerolineales bacterium]